MKWTIADPENDPQLINLDDGAKRAKMSRRTLERRLAEGVIPVARRGGRGGKLRTYVWVDDLDLYWRRLRSHHFGTRKRGR